ncbi:MAG: hypothetical protein PHU44_06695 [Syntrophales bacterium]|nr:hypothetical protein [Syntrophales bacterium]MDD5641528.1 hypothetical protein [Syntrophales bacterium]
MSVNLDSPSQGILTDWPLLRELRAVAAGRLCGAEEKRRCRTENGVFTAWACAVCEEYLRPEALSPWTWHLLFLYRLQRAGYPFRANDLSLETWLLLGVVQKVLENTQRGKNARRQNHGI